MDPDTTLAALYAAVDDLREATEREHMMTALAEISEHASALDLWLVRGGFLPTTREG